MAEQGPAELWARHDAAWRDPAQVAGQWSGAAAPEPELLRARTRGDFWGAVERSGGTLLVTREYEHLVMALTVLEGRPLVTYLRLPHPSGVAVDEKRGVVHLASTRNPNQLYELAPVTGVIDRRDRPAAPPPWRMLVPVAARYLPGSMYVHDLAMVGGTLHANAVGMNAVARVPERGGAELVWWPKAIEDARGRPDTTRNYLQLNSIAAGRDLRSSFFSASGDAIGRRRPGHRNYPVDRRGVIFSGRTREPVARGLTRPHSARFDSRGRLWVANSGYGELGLVRDGAFEPVARVPAWTRGLCVRKGTAFVGGSRVIPRFRQYAPGLDGERSECAVHAVDTASGSVVGSLIWPYGNQIFSIEWAPARLARGFPFAAGRRGLGAEAIKRLFYAFETDPQR